jgi:hypothetical protein
VTRAPILYTWSGEAMIPSPRLLARCNEQFEIGHDYRLIEHEERSTRSHNHQFAEIHDAWLNLPEELQAQYPSDEHLRKFALIMTGWSNKRQLVCRSAVEAERFARFMRPQDEYAVIDVTGNIITEFTAKSQSKRKMSAADFQKSKTDILHYVAAMARTTAQDLKKNAETVA